MVRRVQRRAHEDALCLAAVDALDQRGSDGAVPSTEVQIERGLMAAGLLAKATQAAIPWPPGPAGEEAMEPPEEVLPEGRLTCRPADPQQRQPRANFALENIFIQPRSCFGKYIYSATLFTLQLPHTFKNPP